MKLLQERLRALSPESLRGIRRGIEKEGLRVRPDGTLATTPHPAALGSALTHPHITTDFSESQLELITGVHTSVEACLAELRQIHQFVLRHIGDEVMWCASMPCTLPADDAIPLGRYGSSNLGQAKTVYRMGLSHRYGRHMQTISGLHYNFSLPSDTWLLPGLGGPNEAYFALIRNFRRHAWLLLYLFGSSPACCASFVEGRTHALQQLRTGTLYLPYATSLRMGRLGYLSDAQDTLAVSYNNLESYTASLYDALTRPYPTYEAIGIHDGRVAGAGAEAYLRYRQLATSLLQIENEFYSTIRPKRVIRRGERPLHALRERGVEYVEVRAMDLDPYSNIGIGPGTVRFLDVFLLHCVLSESPPDTPQEIDAIGRNKQRVAARGRDPGLRLERQAQLLELREWGGQVLVECEPIAAALDQALPAQGGRAYRDALSAAAAALDHPDSLPSARMLDEIRRRHDGSYVRFALERSLQHRGALRDAPLATDLEAGFARLAQESLQQQREVEAADTETFEDFRQRYLARETLGV
jgi:glutamate--cysteine ligase